MLWGRWAREMCREEDSGSFGWVARQPVTPLRWRRPGVHVQQDIESSVVTGLPWGRLLGVQGEVSGRPVHV